MKNEVDGHKYAPIPVLPQPHAVLSPASVSDISIVPGDMAITPKIAARVIEQAHFPGQRRISVAHVALLAHIMEDGRWQAGRQITFGHLGGSFYLTNGNHRMHAVVASKTTQVFSVQLVECRSMSDVEADYRSHDTIARKRGVADIVATMSGICDGSPAWLRKALYNAAPLLASELTTVAYQSDPVGSRDIENRADVMREWSREATEYARMIDTHGVRVAKHMRKQGVMAVALYTIRYQPELAWKFWPGVAADDGLRANDPRKALANDLTTRNLNTGTHGQRSLPATVAWNAFFEGRTLTFIRVTDKSRVMLKGTPIK